MDCPRYLANIVVIGIFIFAQIPFSLAGWIAVGDAPQSAGTYDVVIQAIFDGVEGTYPLELMIVSPARNGTTPNGTNGTTPNGTAPPVIIPDFPACSEGDISIRPIFPVGRVPPIDLKYEILVNGSTMFNMVSNAVTLYYMSDETLLRSDEMALTLGDDGYWHAMVNVPFKGDYKAIIQVTVDLGGDSCSSAFATHFNSITASGDLVIAHDIDKRILATGEEFEVTAEVLFEDQIIPDLEIIKTNLYGDVRTLNWRGGRFVYAESMTAPRDEGA
jgi:hypothetical protein